MPHLDHDTLTFSDFRDLHETQLRSSNVPEIYWPTIHDKLQRQVYDAGEAFQLMKVEGESSDDYSWRVVVVHEGGLSAADPKHIYLIDHAWTYRSSEARGQLAVIPGLLDRMAALMDITADDTDEKIDAVMREMWKFNQTYTLTEQDSDSLTFWYVMDEFGSRIQHNDDPTFRIAPLLYSPMGISFTLLWPVQEVACGDEVTRDYVEWVQESSKRTARLLPWIPHDMSSLDFALNEPSDDYFDVYRGDETVPDGFTSYEPIRDRSLKVYVDVPTFRDHLTDLRFEFVDSVSDADVIWCQGHWKDFRQLSERNTPKLINQFPGEFVVTMKDLLAVVARRCADDTRATPLWFPTTYNLNTQISQFVSFFQNNSNDNEPNVWIIKPYNKSRGLDIHITDDLSEIVRLPDTGPQVACKYIERPVLFDRSDIDASVKFDLRYIVLLHRAHPLKLSVYNMFWLRFANKGFSLDKFDDYEKHFTVMNYRNDSPLKQMHYADFIEEFEKQNPSYSWHVVQRGIYDVFRELFHAAASQPYPRGIHGNPTSRAMYGIDVMLQWNTDESGNTYIQPMLCEVNFCPDCVRACDYEPEFANDVFAALFLDDINERFTLLT